MRVVLHSAEASVPCMLFSAGMGCWRCWTTLLGCLLMNLVSHACMAYAAGNGPHRGAISPSNTSVWWSMVNFNSECVVHDSQPISAPVACDAACHHEYVWQQNKSASSACMVLMPLGSMMYTCTASEHPMDIDARAAVALCRLPSRPRG